MSKNAKFTDSSKEGFFARLKARKAKKAEGNKPGRKPIKAKIEVAKAKVKANPITSSVALFVQIMLLGILGPAMVRFCTTAWAEMPAAFERLFVLKDFLVTLGVSFVAGVLLEVLLERYCVKRGGTPWSMWTRVQAVLVALVAGMAIYGVIAVVGFAIFVGVPAVVATYKYLPTCWNFVTGVWPLSMVGFFCIGRAFLGWRDRKIIQWQESGKAEQPK